jgi:hypothetical protein
VLNSIHYIVNRLILLITNLNSLEVVVHLIVINQSNCHNKSQLLNKVNNMVVAFQMILNGIKLEAKETLKLNITLTSSSSSNNNRSSNLKSREVMILIFYLDEKYVCEIYLIYLFLYKCNLIGLIIMISLRESLIKSIK